MSFFGVTLSICFNIINAQNVPLTWLLYSWNTDTLPVLNTCAHKDKKLKQF